MAGRDPHAPGAPGVPGAGTGGEPSPAGQDCAAGGASAPASEARILRRRLKVVAVANGVATLEAPRAPACGSCAAKAGCGAAALAGLSAPLRLRAPAPPGMRPGDEVEAQMQAGDFLGAMALCYLAPPAALVAAAGVFAALDLPDLLSAALCLPVFALSLLPLRLAERRGRAARALTVSAPAPDPAP